MGECLILRFEHKHTSTRKEKPKMVGHDQWFPSSSSRSECPCLQNNVNGEVDVCISLGVYVEDGAHAVELLVKCFHQAALKSNLEKGLRK